MSLVLVNRCHDLREQGAKGRGGLSEWILAREINKGIMEIRNKDHRFYYPPTNPLSTRVDRMNRYCRTYKGRDVYALEVHCNRVKDPYQAGFFAITWHMSPLAQALALSILAEIGKLRPGAEDMGVCLASNTDRWIGHTKQHKGSRLAFLSDTVCPAVIIEAAHLSNVWDLQWISDVENRLELGRAIGRGTIKHLNAKGVPNGQDRYRMDEVCLD